MGQYTGTNTWINQVYQFEETDLVQADTDNIPLQQLADRTVWLKNKIGLFDRLSDEVVITQNASIPPTLAGHLILALSNGIMTITLENASTFQHGALVPISSLCNPSCVVNVRPQPGQPIYDGDGAVFEMHMHQNEQLLLCAFTDHWRLLSANGNFYCAGEEIKGRKAFNNTLPLNGVLLERARFPRLWKFVSTLSLYQEIVPEALWFYDSTTYRGCFSVGDGQTTFRLPDERGMFERMLDQGRGIDYNRLHNFAGGYEPDYIKSHSHTYRDRYFRESLSEFNKIGAYQREYMGNQNNKIGSSGTDTDNDYAGYIDASTGNAGDSYETTTKNIGKIHLIKF